MPSFNAYIPSFFRKVKTETSTSNAVHPENKPTSPAEASNIPSSSAQAFDYRAATKASDSNRFRLFGDVSNETKNEVQSSSQHGLTAAPNNKKTLAQLFAETPHLHGLTDAPNDKKTLAQLFAETPHLPQLPTVPLEKRVIDPETKEVNKEQLKELSVQLQEFLDKASVSFGKAFTTELKDELSKLAALADQEVNDGRAHEIAGSNLGNAVRDSYAKAKKICEKHAKKAADGSGKQAKLSAMAALFSELKRHHLSASATPAFKEFGEKETGYMMQANPGMVLTHSGAGVFNTKAASLGVTFGAHKIAHGEAGMGFEKAEELMVDDDADQNSWSRYGLTGRLGVVLNGGIIGGKIQGKIKTSYGTNYTESESYQDQAKIFAKYKIEDSYVNKMSPSAGSSARKWKEWFKGYGKTTKALTGAAYTSAHAPIYLTEKKVAKGSHNTSIIHALAKKVDPQLGMLMEEAYPPLTRPMTYSPVSLPVGGAGRRGKEGVSFTAVEMALEGSMSVGIPGLATVTDGYMSAGANVSGALTGRRREYDNELMMPTHTLLSAAFTKSMQKSLDIWNMIEERSPNDSRLSSKLSLYKGMKDAIRNATGDYDPKTLYDAAFFGPESTIPEAFLNSIRAPDDKLDALADVLVAECNKLGKVYETFQQNAGILNAVSERRASQQVKKQYTTLQSTAFAAINESVWGAAGGSGAKLSELIGNSGGKKRKEFLADSYDVISTALGGAGTHLEILKAKVAAMDNPPADLVKKIMEADASYSKVNEALLKADIPLHESTLHRYSTVTWFAPTTKNEIEGKLSLSVGAQPDFVQNAMETYDTETTMALDTAALGISGTATVRWSKANHPNLTRGGDFRDMSLSIGAGPGPLLGTAVEKVVIAAITKMRKDLDGVDIAPAEIAAIRDSIKTMMSTGVLDNVKNIVLSWKQHKFSEAGDTAYRQQYFRVAEQGSNTVGAPVTIPLAPHVTLTAGASVAQSMSIPLYEMMGPDLSYHLLAYTHLDEVHKEAKAAHQNAQFVARMSGNMIYKVPDELELLRTTFDSNSFRKNQFFSTNAILDVVKDYGDFLDWKSKGLLPATRPESGFLFYDRPEIQEVAKNARKVESLAAGKSLFTVEKNAQGGEELKKQQEPPSLTEPLSDVVSKEELEAFEQKIQTKLAQKRADDPEATLTPDERADLFLSTKEGKRVFESYMKIISTYKEINKVSLVLLGYDGRLREERQEHQDAKRVGTAIKNGGVALKSLVQDGTQLHPSLVAGDEAANVLDQRGYFDAGRKRNYGDLQQHEQSLTQADMWLELHSLAKAENGSAGIHSLIVAYLQHATGRYDSLHVDEAAKYISQLGSNTPSEEQIQAIIEQINHKYGAVQARMIAPGDDGAPVWTGDVGAPEQGRGRSVAIMRSKNDQGEDTFAAVVHRKHPSARDIPEHLKKLDEARRTRAAIVGDSPQGQDFDLTGTQLREMMNSLGTKQRGPMKNMAATLADGKRPVRKELRNLTDTELDKVVEDGLLYNAENDVDNDAESISLLQEAVKEKGKRDEMKKLLTSAIRRPTAQMTGKDVQDAQNEQPRLKPGSMGTIKQMEAKFKFSKTAEVTTRLSGEELNASLENPEYEPFTFKEGP